MTSEHQKPTTVASSPTELTRDEILALFARRQEAYDDLDAAALAADYADDVVIESPMSGRHGKADAERNLRAFFDAFLDLKTKADAVYVAVDQLIVANRPRILALAVGERLPTIFSERDFVKAGALMSYGPNYSELFRHSADFVDKILRGTKPADIPVEQPTKFELVINLTTAKALGLKIPPSVLARADDVIE